MPRSWFGLALTCAVWAAVARSDEPIRLVPERARVSPGRTVSFRVEPASLATLGWRVVGLGSVTANGEYAAPYVVPRARTAARVVATCAGQTSVLFAADVDLQPGTFPGAEDCLGEGQAWPAHTRGIDYVPVDQLPVATRRVEPEYSRADEARGLRGTLVVNAIVCRTGSVLDAWVTWPEGAAPNRELEVRALEAVHRWSFSPASFQGSPRAIVVAIPMRFPPP